MRRNILRNPAMVIKALDYQEDINFSEPIEMLEGKYKWKDIEVRLNQMTMEPNRLFKELPTVQKINLEVKKNNMGKDLDQGYGLGM